jgi:lipoprotein-anchoring transpeptidase ErfK/SrfK
MDALRFRLKIVGYRADGAKLTYTTAAYSLLPRICLGKPQTSICVSKARQRLYYLHEGSVRRMHVVSTAARGYRTPTMRPGSYDRSRGTMGKVFYKSYAPFSRQYQVVMYHWLAITSSGSHGIHATSPNQYRRLGRPASHGCIRQHRTDARVLWELVRVGTPVYVL